jgi:membrane protein required for colicin V production
MNGIDIVLLGILILALIRGFIKGFIMQVAGLAALILGIYAAIHFSDYLGRFLENKISLDPVIIRWLAFGILFTLVVLAVHFLGKLVEKLAKITTLSFLNRVAGAFFAGIKAIFILAALVTMLNVLDQKIHFLPAEKMGKSIFYKPLSKLIPSLFPRFFHKPVEKEQSIPEEQIIVAL